MTPLFILLYALVISFPDTEKRDYFIGFWRSDDPQTGQWIFTAEIYEEQGKLLAKVVELPPNAALKSCEKCKPPLKNQPLLGMDIVWNLDFLENRLENGKILDPATGKVYDCTMWIGTGGTLHVRGYFKFKAFGQTQIWQPVKKSLNRQ